MDPVLTARFHPAIAEIEATAWNALLPAGAPPFIRHEFLHTLERTGCIQPRAGWAPWHLGLYRDQQLVAAAPCYLKGNSHGEFVFDWRWAEAHARIHGKDRHGRGYYPKLVVGVPYTPVSGPRLLAPPGPETRALRRALLEALRIECERHRLSSAHVNFLAEAEAAACTCDPWLPRFDWQFHWRRAGERDFADLLDRMHHKARKNIRQERAKIAAAGVRFEWRAGEHLSAAEWSTVHTLYRDTFERKLNHAALTEEFFPAVARSLPGSMVLCLAYQTDSLIAMAVFWRSADTLYGRYWGSRVALPGLHFEACYYQGLEFCLRHGLQGFEPGAQGEHKLARGFLPVRTRSVHFITDPVFRHLIRAHLAIEAEAQAQYGTELARHLPFKRGA